MAPVPPFIIYSLPRSRTAWLSKVLTFGGWRCYHEIAIKFREVHHIGEFFGMPRMGTIETAAAPGRALISAVRPDIREAVILRPVEDVMASFRALDISSVGTYDWPRLEATMRRGTRTLERIARDSRVLVVQHADLGKEETIKAIWQHCLPIPFNQDHYVALKDRNIQSDVPEYVREYHRNLAEITRFKALCKTELWRLCHAPPQRKAA